MRSDAHLREHDNHYEMLRAFVDDETLARVSRDLDSRAYRTHEYGDSVLMERSAARASLPRPAVHAESA